MLLVFSRLCFITYKLIMKYIQCVFNGIGNVNVPLLSLSLHCLKLISISNTDFRGWNIYPVFFREL